jgi:chromosome segregation ATPase
MSDIAATLKKELTEISEKASRVMRDYSTMTARAEAAESELQRLTRCLRTISVMFGKIDGTPEDVVATIEAAIKQYQADWGRMLARAEAAETQVKTLMCPECALNASLTEQLRKVKAKLDMAMGELRGYQGFADTKEVIDAIERAT